MDSLIVHDLITLAYARAVSSMYLLGGDEDLREGVAAAQRQGVQLSLMGIDTGEPNQALTLIHEADEHVLLPRDDFAPHFRTAGTAEAVSAPVEREQTLVERVRAQGEEFARNWAEQSELAQIGELVARAPEIPRELDVQLLLRTEEQLEISLRGATELRHALRAAFWSTIKRAAEARS